MNNANNILLFSDDKVFTTIIKQVLESHFGADQTLTFSSFPEAKTINEGDAPAFIIVDDIISGTTSLELIRFLRVQKKIRSKIYYFSIVGSTEEHKALLRGANFFVRKPFKPDEFIELVKLNIN